MAERTALGWIAYWHTLVWKAEPTTIDQNGNIKHGLVERFNDLKLDYSLKTVKIKTKKDENAKKYKTVEATLQSNEITFETTYKVAAGTRDINAKLNELKDLIGTAAPLVIANYDTPAVWGSFYMQLTAISTSGVKIDEVGRIYEATVQFTLTEAQDKKVKKVAMSYAAVNPESSTAQALAQFVKDGEVPREFRTALKICPDPDIKALLKNKKKK